MDTKSLCLGVLTLGDASGYDIRKRLAEQFGYFMDVSPSAIYPALATLHREGAVALTRVPRDDRPDKKMYSVTESGRRQFLDALLSAPARHRVRSEFMILLFFSHLLPAWRLQQIVEERLQEFDRLIELTGAWLETEGQEAPTGVQFTAGYGLAVMRAARDYIQSHRQRLSGASAPAVAPAVSRATATRRIKA
jgi:DNA-binding PadR family transcriptional regulator